MTPPLEKILFLAASSLTDEDERRMLLDLACGEDAALRKKIEDLFAVQGAAAEFFENRPEVQDAAPATLEAGLGTQIGRYRLIERIGAGGWGLVYFAEQCEPVQRKVALKIIRIGMDTESVIARFNAERQSLALMDHPNIARVLDAGSTASGRPFFVMEFVDGEKFTDFCDANRLEISQRLEIFVQVCLAIQHAHQKGVIHRDIKPSNILVRMHDGVPTSKVIDFGIARATARSLADDPRLTVSDQLLGTPAYMSPEMAAGGMDLDTRSDIHSLGVVLYELLTGRTPFSAERLQKMSLEEIRRVFREEDPLPPSSLLGSLGDAELDDIAGRRGVDRARLMRTVKGELDWIVMKAMERDRERRYETAYGLVLDVQRFLRNEPVNAGPPDRFYRLAKFIRRNKVPFVSATFVVLALIGGFGTSTVLFFQEKEARSEQERLRVAADVARANESMLRERAEYREYIAQAAVKLSHGDIEAADRLLAKVPFGYAPPSLEAAQSYSKVGEWHVLAGRWREATDRFASVALLLASADPSDSAAVSVTLIPAAATLSQSGDRERYEVIRRMAIERFRRTTSPVVAEQVLKAALLLPANQQTLGALKPLATFLEHTIAAGHPELANNSRGVAWCWFALALMKYREGDVATAYSWVNRSLAIADRNPSREAGSRCIMSLIESRLGHVAEARAQLGIARPSIDAVFAQKMELGNLDSFWFDWVVARILYREARSQLGN